MNPSPDFAALVDRNSADVRTRRAARIEAVKLRPLLMHKLVARAIERNPDEWAHAVCLAVGPDNTALQLLVSAVLVDDARDGCP